MSTHLPRIWPAEPHHGDPVESSGVVFHYGIHKVRCPDGHVQNFAAIDLGMGEDRVYRLLDAQSHMCGGRSLAGGQHSPGLGLEGIDVENGGIGIGSADVHADSVHARESQV